MGHKYNRRDGTWNMSFRYQDKTTVIRACPVCGFAQPLDSKMLGIIDFSKCPRCKAKLDVPKKIEDLDPVMERFKHDKRT